VGSGYIVSMLPSSLAQSVPRLTGIQMASSKFVLDTSYVDSDLHGFSCSLSGTYRIVTSFRPRHCRFTSSRFI